MRSRIKTLADKVRIIERHVVVSSLNSNAKIHLSNSLKVHTPERAWGMYNLLTDTEFKTFLGSMADEFSGSGMLVRIDDIAGLELELTSICGLQIQVEEIHSYPDSLYQT